MLNVELMVMIRVRVIMSTASAAAAVIVAVTVDVVNYDAVVDVALLLLHPPTVLTIREHAHYVSEQHF